jgi:nucleolar protein 58
MLLSAKNRRGVSALNVGKDLRKFLKKHADGETLAIADAKLGGLIKEKMGIVCVYSTGVMELMRGVRYQLNELVGGLSDADIAPMALGLSHSLSRYKLKFSPDKVDTMVVQAIGLLDGMAQKMCARHAIHHKDHCG